MRQQVMLLAGLLLATSLFVGMEESSRPLAAQEKAKKAKKEIKNRLPNYYAKVVDGAQREKIYGIQNEYAPKIEALEKQLMALEQERDKKIEALLRPDQLKLLNRLKAEAQTRRDARKKEREKEEAKDSQ